MNREERIRDILSKNLSPTQLGIENESHQHAGPASETHYKVLIVGETFKGLNRVERQRRVQDLLKEEFETGLHALTQRALTPEEYESGAADGFISPACMGKR